MFQIGYGAQFARCNVERCPQPGIWTAWTVTRNCSAICGEYGTLTSQRKCGSNGWNSASCVGSPIRHGRCQGRGKCEIKSDGLYDFLLALVQRGLPESIYQYMRINFMGVRLLGKQSKIFHLL